MLAQHPRRLFHRLRVVHVGYPAGHPALAAEHALHGLDLLDGRLGGVPPLVPGLGAGPLDGLLDGVRCQHTEPDGHAVLAARGCNALDALASHVIEVRRAAANDGAQRDDAIGATTGSHFFYSQRHFEGTGHAHDIDIGIERKQARQSAVGVFIVSVLATVAFLGVIW